MNDDIRANTLNCIIEKGVAEIKADVKAITAKPGKLQDKIIAAVIVALATGMIGAILALILK